MSLRCGCPDQGDDIVFGPAHECTVDPSVRVKRVSPQWPWGAVIPSPVVAPCEPRYLETLDEAERRGD